jgi:hypothetical protein
MRADYRRKKVDSLSCSVETLPPQLRLWFQCLMRVCVCVCVGGGNFTHDQPRSATKKHLPHASYRELKRNTATTHHGCLTKSNLSTARVLDFVRHPVF